jgi:hypothetical protein
LYLWFWLLLFSCWIMESFLFHCWSWVPSFHDEVLMKLLYIVLLFLRKLNLLRLIEWMVALVACSLLLNRISLSQSTRHVEINVIERRVGL